MMKSKLFLLSLGLTVLLVGCNNENDAGTSPGGSAMASFRTELPGTVTQATDDTYTPSRYIMEIYPGTTATGTPDIRIEQDNGLFDHVKLTYEVTYTCLFWADNGTPDDAANDEYIATDLKAAKLEANTCPTHPAYAGTVRITAGTSAVEDYSVRLTHAVAKVSYIQDQRAFTAADNTLAVAFPITYRLNVEDGSVSEIENTTTTHTFAGIGQVDAGTTIATGYVIAPSVTASTQNITVTLNNETSKTISNVPLQRNYNTNLRGAFSDLYNSEMTCDLTQEWGTPEEEKDLISIWDGTTVTQPASYSSATPGEVKITSAAELAWLAEQSNNANRVTFSGYTFTLTTDIDLKSHLWPQIGCYGFQGTLDGGGHTVRGMRANNNDAEKYAGFIYYLGKGGTVKNLTVRGSVSGSLTGSEWLCLGGIAGYAEKATIENCHNACTVMTDGETTNAGGIAGEADVSVIRNCTNSGTIGNTENAGQVRMGGIVGELSGDVVGKSASSILSGNMNKGKIACTSIYKGALVGGIVGYVSAWGITEVSNNVNGGDIECTSGESGAYNELGGIIGGFYESSGSIEMTINGNRNEGNVSSQYERDKVGGIVGVGNTGMDAPAVALTDNVIEKGTPATIVIGLCITEGGMTVDGVPVTNNKPYPYNE